MYPSWQVFEHPTAAMMALLLKDNDVCFDIGANWGCMSLIAATITGYHGPIHAFEPIPSTFADLEETVRQAKLEGRIVCHRFALSDRGGTGKMILPDRVNSGWAKLADDGTIEVTLARLDDLVLPDPTFIKIDAEDHEFSILRGAESMLRRTRPYLMFENWVDMRHPELFLAPLRWLEERGYRLYVPGWIWHTANDQCVLYDNDPPRDGSGPMIALLPIIPEHRALMSAHLSLFAAHRDRLSELAEALGSPKTLSVEEGHSPIAMGP
jgi:FkbM family methyltransferase